MIKNSSFFLLPSSGARPGGRLPAIRGPGGLGLLALLLSAWILPRQEPRNLLDRYDLSPDAGVQVKLPRVLEEISGLALTPDGRLFAHNDERAVAYEIDPSTGEVRKAFSIGLMGTPGDFEGFAITGERFFLLASTGQILEFREGAAGESVGYRIHDLRLQGVCEMEGLAVDAAKEELLLPCKTPRANRLEGHIVVLSVPLSTMQLNPTPRIFFSLSELEEKAGRDKFHPSAVEVDPATGSFLLVAAREEALLELGPSGEFRAARELKRRAHPQPEGLALLPDGTLILADEGRGGRGTLTRYAPIQGAGGGGR